MCVCECKETNLQEAIMCNDTLHITDSFKLHQASLSYLLSLLDFVFFSFLNFGGYFFYYLYFFVCLGISSFLNVVQ